LFFLCSTTAAWKVVDTVTLSYLPLTNILHPHLPMHSFTHKFLGLGRLS
jgi:hypothetical protein